MAALSWMCCDSNLPFFFNITFTDIKTIAIAIINTVRIKVSIIFAKFALR